MKRRDFSRYFALSMASSVQLLNQPKSTISATPKTSYPWAVLYWMPYDNDLVGYGEPILGMLAEGTKHADVIVAVQSDYFKDAKMRRRILVNGSIHEMNILGNNSSDASEFSAYLDWARKTFTAKHWAVIVAGHGGKLDEISPDNFGRDDQSRRWMKLDKFVDAVNHFNQQVGDRVELLFFQNCHKATLEVVYEARNCAKYTLASQLLLGAPNYYYKGFLSSLKNPFTGGKECGIAIANSERLDMYHTFTLINNQAIAKIPNYLNRLIEAILKQETLPDASQLTTYQYFGERYCDMRSLLQDLSKSHDSQNRLTEFSNFLQQAVIANFKQGGLFYQYNRRRSRFTLNHLTGLSLLAPDSEQTLSRYQSLALHRKVNLLDLHRKVFL
jgi:Clostripain family